MSINLRQRIIKGLSKILKVDYYANPTRLDDDPDQVYIWKVDDEEDTGGLAEYIDQSFIKKSGRSPEAMHLVVADVDEIEEIDGDDFENKIKPWIKKEG